MLTWKGIYPYIYMDSYERFDKDKLPEKEAFFSDLSKEHISQEDFEFLHKLWKEFGLKNLGELHDLYMETDVYLLADVFDIFRIFSLENYKLDPAHFSTAPGLSWSAALMYTKIELEIPTDPDMHMFFDFDRGLTSGISIVANHYAKANNDRLERYDLKQKKTAKLISLIVTTSTVML